MRNLTTKVRGCVLGVVLALTSTVGFAVESCNTGPVLCCNSILTVDTTSVGFLKNVTGMDFNIGSSFGLVCEPITAIGGGSVAQCSSTPVCCTNSFSDGLIVTGCTPVLGT